MHLTATLKNVNALLGGNHWIAVELRPTLLELGKVLNGFQSSLRAEEPLDIHPSERRRVNAVTGTPVAERLLQDEWTHSCVHWSDSPNTTHHGSHAPSDGPQSG